MKSKKDLLIMALRSAIEMYGKLLPPNDYYDIDKICGDPSMGLVVKD